MMVKWRRMVMCFGRWEGASVLIVVCYDRREKNTFLSRYECSKFGQDNKSIFVAPCKIAQKYACGFEFKKIFQETGPHLFIITLLSRKVVNQLRLGRHPFKISTFLGNELFCEEVLGFEFVFVRSS